LKTMIRIGIVDDKAVNRNIIKEKLDKNGLFKICLSATDGKDFLDKVKLTRESERPEVVLMDLEMPEMDGVAAIAAGSSLYPSIKFVVLTIYDDEDKIFKAIKAGAFGYLLKDESGSQISDMLWQMYESGAGPISPGIAHKILQLVQKNQLTILGGSTMPDKDLFFELSDREQEILKLLVQGLSYKEIAAELFISPSTAKKHVMNIYNKLHVNSKAQAIRLAYEKGLL
jgi:DNA-binding NarL/FixJ family response regulator